jgi:hypothetical protein
MNRVDESLELNLIHILKACREVKWRILAELLIPNLALFFSCAISVQAILDLLDLILVSHDMLLILT